MLASKRVVIQTNIAKQVGCMDAENSEITIFTKSPVIKLTTHHKDNSTSYIFIICLVDWSSTASVVGFFDGGHSKLLRYVFVLMW